MSRKVVLTFVILFSFEAANAWGFWGHKRINRMACFTLPPALFVFYKNHINYLEEHAPDPDKRRYSDAAEPPRHYIDLDHYGLHPFDSIPVYWNDAMKKFTEDSLLAYGIVPWHITHMYYSLREAFRKRDVSKILFYSANIGHYIGDAHVPLHCTENYNGQLTGQNGIHGFWESRLPELFGDDYDFLTGRAEYIEKIQPYCWKILKQSFAAHDSVLQFEKLLNDRTPSDRKYAYETRGALVVKTYSREYSLAYQVELDGQVERRMRAAILAVGSIWYSAWLEAGSPDLLTDLPANTVNTTDTVVVQQNNSRLPNARICEE